MFHVVDNLFVGRMNDTGDVRLLRFKSPPLTPPNANGVYSSLHTEADLVICAEMWPSVVASVSRMGENFGRFYQAQAFHNNVIDQPAWPKVPTE